MDAQRRREVGRLGGLTRVANQTPDQLAAQMAGAREAFEKRFENEPNPAAARKLYFARLAERGREARRLRDRNALEAVRAEIDEVLPFTEAAE